ncbi:MAG: septum formation initiator family protein [candidate division WOR-3 bacterium]|jgi:cell division protein FtsB
MNHHSRRRRKIILLLAIFLIVVAGVFLPGPNGLVSVLIKIYRINRYRTQIQQLRTKADSLEAEIKLWQDPDYATRQARRLFNKHRRDTLK